MIIALGGEKGSGKNYIADQIEAVLPSHVSSPIEIHKLAFAYPVKEICKTIFGWNDDRIEFGKEIIDNRYGISPRQAMQYIGTELGQEGLRKLSYTFDIDIRRDIWCHALKRQIEETYSATINNSCFIITDLRFPHEANFIRSNFPKQKVLVCRVVRDLHKVNEDSHLSENLIDRIPFDLCINNLQNSIEETKKEILIKLGELWQQYL